MARHYFCSICDICRQHQRRKGPQEFRFNVACINGLDLEALDDIPMTDDISMNVETNN
ncbi:MAG: hypothetical protein WDZ52_10835 [Pseudohongiellaceae bacterium]